MHGIKYYIQKLFAICLYDPIIPKGKTSGFSLVRSERLNSNIAKHTKIVAPYVIRNVELGEYSYMASNGNVSNCTIGKFCSIGPNFCCGLGLHPTNGISTAPMFYSVAKQNGVSLVKENIFQESKQTIIGNDVFIGANVTVVDGVTIGNGAIIGACAVVVKDIPPYAIAVGVPAKVVKYRFDNITISKLQSLEWWNWDDEYLKKIAENEFNVAKFVSDL